MVIFAIVFRQVFIIRVIIIVIVIIFLQTYEPIDKEIEIIMKTQCAESHIPYGCTKSLEINLAGVLGGMPHKIELDGKDITINGQEFTDEGYYQRYEIMLCI